MSYVEQFDVKHKRFNEPIKERERAMEHTHISDTVKMVSVLHHFFIAPAAAAIFPFVLKTLFREHGARASCFGNFIAIFQILPPATRAGNKPSRILKFHKHNHRDTMLTGINPH